tara:strand:- start:24 stop:398 length:375 start_codon:yes stop_codon:yes gene_type:complete
MITPTSFLVSSIVILVLDYVYLTLTKHYFSRLVQIIQGSPLKMRVLSAGVTYIFLIFALQYFIFNRESEDKVKDAFFLGLCIYGVFDLTNRTIFKDWSLMAVVMDTLWGGMLFAGTTYITLKLL